MSENIYLKYKKLKLKESDLEFTYTYSNIKSSYISTRNKLKVELNNQRKKSRESREMFLKTFHNDFIKSKFNILNKPKYPEIFDDITSQPQTERYIDHQKNRTKSSFFLTNKEEYYTSQNNENNMNHYKNFPTDTNYISTFMSSNENKANQNPNLNTDNLTSNQVPLNKIPNIKFSKLNERLINKRLFFSPNNRQNNERMIIKFDNKTIDCLQETIKGSLKLHTIPRMRREKNSEFLSRNKAFRKENIIKNCLMTEVVNIKEDNAAKLEREDNCLFFLRKIRKLILIFEENFNQYLIFLNSEISKELTKLNSVQSEKVELEFELTSINKQINKNKELLLLYRQYKLFLLMVKFNVKRIEKIPKPQLIHFGLSEYVIEDKIRESKNLANINKYIKKSTKNALKINNNTNTNTNNNLNSNTLSKSSNTYQKLLAFGRYLVAKNLNPSRRKSSTILYNEDYFNNIENKFIDKYMERLKNKRENEGDLFYDQEKYNDEYHGNYPIFNDTEEFMDKFHQLENKTFNLFKKHTMSNDFKRLVEYKNKMEKIERENEMIIIKEYTQENNTFISLKNKYQELVKIRDELKSKSKTVHETSELIYEKMKYFLKNIKINIENEFQIEGFYKFLNSKNDMIFYNGVKMNKNLFLLSVYEKILLAYIDIRKKHENSPTEKVLYDQIVLSLNKQRKKEKNELLKREKERNRIDKGLKIVEKYNRILFIPDKRNCDKSNYIYNIKLRETEKRKRDKELEMEEKNELNNLENFLSY